MAEFYYSLTLNDIVRLANVSLSSPRHFEDR